MSIRHGGGQLCSIAVDGRAFEYTEDDGHPHTVDDIIGIRKSAKTHDDSVTGPRGPSDDESTVVTDCRVPVDITADAGAVMCWSGTCTDGSVTSLH